jgi:hypothetical protein
MTREKLKQIQEMTLDIFSRGNREVTGVAVTTTYDWAWLCFLTVQFKGSLNWEPIMFSAAGDTLAEAEKDLFSVVTEEHNMMMKSLTRKKRR